MADFSLRAALLVAAGGALGCVLRYAAGAWLTRSDGYPWGTLAVNVAGSFLIAVLMFGLYERGMMGSDARFLLVTGVLGGFTTMSSFAYETLAIAQRAAWWRGAGYVALTLAGSLGAAWLGRAAARAI